MEIINDAKTFLEIKLNLIDLVLLDMPVDVIDISYDFDRDNINIQIVLLKGSILEKSRYEKLNYFFKDYTVKIKTIFISRDFFNERRGEWLPHGYTWLSNILFSKAEIL